MRQLDLGPCEGPIVLFGGPYSNLQATEALLSTKDVANAETLICTGDVVAYAADASATIAAVRASGAVVVAGNCEKQLAAGAADCGCGFEEGSACDLLSVGWFSHANAQVGQADRAWMARLPDIVTFSHAGRRYGVIHGGVTDIARFIWPETPTAVFDREWAAAERHVGPLDAIVCGHSGLPFVRTLDQGDWINAGVIGMPPHDGAPQTRYVCLRAGRATIMSLTYDWPQAQAAMRQVGLTQGYDTALKTGYWPSEDVLPPERRRSSLASG